MTTMRVKRVTSSLALGALTLAGALAWARAAQDTPKTDAKSDTPDVITPKGKVMTWGDASDEDSKAKDGKPLGKGWKSLFDGKTLKGWVGEKGYWEVKDGAIVGDKHGSTPHHHYMFSEKDYADFACHIDIKMTGYNSGVCARIHPVNFDDAPGYQVDMAEGYWGCLWDEHHRQRKIVDYPKDEADKIVHKDAWNHYYFIMKGYHVVMYLNGVKTADVEDAPNPDKKDPGGFLSGPLGFQLCHGDNTVASFKNIYVKLLKPALPGTAPKPAAMPEP